MHAHIEAPNTEAAEALTAAALRSVENTERRQHCGTLARTGNPALDAAINSAEAYIRETERPLAAAHTAAENAVYATRDSTNGDIAALKAAENQANLVWQKALARRDRLVKAILAIPPATTAELKTQIEAYSRLVSSCVSGKPHEIYDGEDMALLVQRTHATLKRLTKPTPPTLDDAATEYADARRIEDHDAHHGGGVADPGREVRALQHLMETPPTNIQGIAARLRALTAELLNADWACHLCGDKLRTELVVPTAAEVFDGDAGDEAARALAALCMQVEQLAAAEALGETPHQAATKILAMCPDPAVRASLEAQWDTAQAARAANRAAEDDEDAESEEGQAAYREAEHGVYRAKAPDLKAVMWKVGDNLIHKLGVRTLDEALAEAEDSIDLDDACQAAIYRDLERIAGVAPTLPPTKIRDLATELEERWAVERKLPTDLSDGDMDAICNYSAAIAHKLIVTPAATLDDFRAKAKAIAWCVNGDLDDLATGSTAELFSAMLVTELLGIAPEPADEAKLAEWDASGQEVVARLQSSSDTAQDVDLMIEAKQWIYDFLNAGGELTYWPHTEGGEPRFGTAWKLSDGAQANAERCADLLRLISDPKKPAPESLNELGREVKRLAIAECERFGLDAIRAEQSDGLIVGPLAVTARWDRAAQAANLTGALSPPAPQLLAAE